MEECLGRKYIQVSEENFEDYLIYIDIGYFNRKVAMTLRPVECLTLNGDGSYTFTYSTLLINTTLTFVLGEEFEEVRPNGDKVTAFITIEGNKMIHTQTEDNGRISKHIREFYPDKMIVTTTGKGLDKVVVRRFELVQ